MQRITGRPYTLVRFEGHTFEPLMHFCDDEESARREAQFLTDVDRALAKVEARDRVVTLAVRTLDSIDKNTQATDLSIADIQWLSGEAVDRLDFWNNVPEWAQKAIESVHNRRFWNLKYIGHVLSAIRCALSVERKLIQAARSEERLIQKFQPLNDTKTVEVPVSVNNNGWTA